MTTAEDTLQQPARSEPAGPRGSILGVEYRRLTLVIVSVIFLVAF